MRIHHYAFIAAIALMHSQAHAQLSVGSAQPMTIGAGMIFHYDGLTMQPSATATLSNITLVRSSAITKRSITPAIGRAYTFSTPVTGFSGTLIMAYAAGELGSIAESNLQLNLNNGTDWSVPAAGILNTTAKTVTVPGLTNATLGEITLASSTAPLPVNLLAFTARKDAQAAVLSWTVGAGSSNDHFSVEHSADAREWSVIGSVSAKQTADYSFRHVDPITGINYYRLQLMDKAGTATYSSVSFLDFNGSVVSIAAWPNPTSGFITVMAPGWANQQVTLADAAGKTLISQRAASGQIVLDMNRLPAGVYFIQSVQGGAAQSIKVNKQ